MNANLRALCTLKHKKHTAWQCPAPTQYQAGQVQPTRETSLREGERQLPCFFQDSPAPRRVRSLNGHAGVQVRPGCRRATSPNGLLLSRHSRSVPEAVCLRGFGQTHPVSLASPLRGRGLGDPAGSTRPPSFWLSWCPSVLLGPGSRVLGPPKKILAVVPSASGKDTDKGHGPLPNILGPRQRCRGC
ncbi:hypothetical protein P4O66_010987 [Electrophorus voltai]|uniref:Uncharacterized protein n=1 Tax=Electrophorus voltai TaxID=2609070 RepID=A0AAD8Z9F5_9TELE|nr:hypothetical protein P4O66_010987 [Electrophorus voltai]